MTITYMNSELNQPANGTLGRADLAKLDATTEQDITRHAQEDDRDAQMDAAKYARRVRKRLGLTQKEFSQRIHVPVDTIRNWEQGKREPAGPAKALLKIFAQNPELALAALER